MRLSSNLYRSYQDACLRLLREDPFYGYVLVRMKIIEDSNMKYPAAVTLKDSEPILFLQTQLFAERSLDHRIFILRHEIHHLLDLHILRRYDRQANLFNIAADLSINTVLPNPPEDVLLPHNVEHSIQEYLDQRDPNNKVQVSLPLHADAESYYALLKNLIPPEAGAVSVHYDPEGGGFVMSEGGIDHHEKWSESDGQTEEQVASTVRNLLEQAASEAQAAGKLPSSLLRQLRERLRPKVNWRRYLNLFMMKSRSSDRNLSYTRLNRRVEMLPGWKRRRKGDVLFCVDTSGSMNEDDITRAATEADRLARLNSLRLHITSCDAEIKTVYHVKGNRLPPEVFQGLEGGGGTLFMPAFEKAKELKCSGVIYFTDGYNFDKLPDRAPLPTLWMITKHGKKPAEWGESILYEE